MENENNVVNGTQEAEGTQAAVNNAAVPQAPVQTVPAVAPAAAEPPKQENWFKAHWKGIVAGATATAAAVASTIVAYKKGKANGIASMPQIPTAPDEDYSLNPNE